MKRKAVLQKRTDQFTQLHTMISHNISPVLGARNRFFFSISFSGTWPIILPHNRVRVTSDVIEWCCCTIFSTIVCRTEWQHVFAFALGLFWTSVARSRVFLVPNTANRLCRIMVCTWVEWFVPLCELFSPLVFDTHWCLSFSSSTVLLVLC